MISYIARRLLQGLAVLLCVSFVCFVIFRYSGDPIVTLSGQYTTEEQREEIRHAFGLDKPFYFQYVRFLANAVRGNFGVSYVRKIPVLDLILERIPASAELAITAVVLALVVGTSLGVLVALKPNVLRNRIIMAASLGGICVPAFLVAILLIMFFSVYLGILPPFGRGDTVRIGFWQTNFLTWSGIKHLILPTLTLVGYQLAVLLRLTRAGMREVLTEEYIKTAWAKGLSPNEGHFQTCLKECTCAGGDRLRVDARRIIGVRCRDGDGLPMAGDG